MSFEKQHESSYQVPRTTSSKGASQFSKETETQNAEQKHETPKPNRGKHLKQEHVREMVKMLHRVGAWGGW